MSHATLTVTKHNPWAVCYEGNATPNADLRTAAHSIISTFTRTVFNGAVDYLSRIELLSTMGAFVGTAIITEVSSAGTGQKILAAIFAWLYRNNDREGRFVFQLRMIIPELLFCYTVTGGAKGYQVLKPISLSIFREQTKRHDVMNREAIALYAAMLASVVIALASGLTSCIPVRASVFLVTAAPSWIIAAISSGHIPSFLPMTLYHVWTITHIGGFHG